MKIDKTRSFTGVDIGTSRLVAARNPNGGLQLDMTLNAFIEVPDMPATVNSLKRQGIRFVRHGGVLLAYGQAATVFAELFHAELRRPMRSGCLNLQEPASTLVLNRIVGELVGEATAKPAVVGFSMPSAGLHAEGVSKASLTNHRSALELMFRNLGYTPYAVNEAEALVYSELEDSGYSGVAISFGAGLTNVAMTYLSVPVLDFSINRGGDDVDSAAAEVLGEKAARVRLYKENNFDLLGTSDDQMSRSIKVFYEELIQHTIGSLATVLVSSTDVPRLDRPIPLVIGGGTTMPAGFKKIFEREIRKMDWPFPISEVRQAKDPLNAVARGVLRYVEVNYGQNEEEEAAAAR